MDVVMIATVGFGSAILGAGAAFLGQKYLVDREFKRRRVGLIRALLGELMQNGAAVTSKQYTGSEVVRHCSQTWQSVRVELGQFLPGNLYDEIDFLYQTLPVAIDVGAGPSDETQVLLEKWQKKLRLALRDLRHLPEAREFKSHYDEIEEAIEKAEAQFEAFGPASDAVERPVEGVSE